MLPLFIFSFVLSSSCFRNTAMGKTKAEIQEAYREWKKKNDQTFQEKEQKRQTCYRVPACELSATAWLKRQRKNRILQKVLRKEVDGT